MTEIDRESDPKAVYLIIKRDLYYMPKAQGYTGIRDLAGRFTLDEAESYSHPNGPNGPRDGITYVHQDKAPEFTKSCYDDLARDYLRDQRDTLLARLAEVEGERDRLRSELAVTREMIRQGDAVRLAAVCMAFPALTEKGTDDVSDKA